MCFCCAHVDVLDSDVFLRIFGKLVPRSIACSRASKSEWTFPCSNSKMNFDDESLAGTFGVSSTST